MKHIPSFGAVDSAKDYRNLQHDQVGLPQIKPSAGVTYHKDIILDQNKVGICTAISLVQNTLAATGKRYSEDFQYLLQKHFFDGGWFEGSSPLNSLKAAKKYGMLPIEHFPSIVAEKPSINYDQYSARLQKIATNPAEMERLLALCEFPIKGYAAVAVHDDALLAQAIADSKAGVIARFSVGSEWWTGTNGLTSWLPKDIEPLRAPKVIVSGHQVSVTQYDFSTTKLAKLANTWSNEWATLGSATFNLNNYRPTEAWVPYFDFTPDYVPLPDATTWSYAFTKPLSVGSTGVDVENLQIKLMIEGCMPRITKNEHGIYGQKTRAGVYAFQKKRKLALSYYENFVLRGSRVGPKTLLELNK